MRPLRGAWARLTRGPLAFALPGALLYTVFRVPSFFEPHWYTDEAGYAMTAREMLRGMTLYGQAWTNKPPLHVWIVALTLELFGPREAAFHAVTFLSGALAFIALALIARQVLSPRRALIATMAFGIALGLPIFQAQLLLPESLLIAPTTWAAWIVFTRLLPAQQESLATWGWAAAAGVLAGIALGIQQTALADAGVFGLILAFTLGLRRALIGYSGAFLVTVAAWLLPAILVAGAPAVAFALVGFYGEYASFNTPNSLPVPLLLRMLGPALALVGAVLARHDPRTTWPIWFWACATLAVNAVANRPYPHYLLPALAPVILALASVRGYPLRRIRWRLMPLVAAFVLTLPLALVGGGDGNALVAYAAWPGAQLTKQRAQWSQQLDLRTTADEESAAWIRANGYSGATAVVWSSSPWLYLLADLPLSLPVAPIYNDVVLMGGSATTVAARVEVIAPTVIVTSDEALLQWPEIKPVLSRDYTVAFQSGPDTVYLRRAP